MLEINSKWTAYQNSVNEGGEGYNPHPKYVTIAAPLADAAVKKYIAGKWRTQAESIKFAKTCLSGDLKAAFLAQTTLAFGA